MISIIVDILSVTPAVPIGVINPFWKFAFVFKCFTDSIILDDFRAALDKLSQRRMAQILPFSNILMDPAPERKRQKKHGGSLDAQPIAEMGILPSGNACRESLDVDGLCPPSPARVNHIEHKYP